MCGCSDRQKVCIGAKKYLLFKHDFYKKNLIFKLKRFSLQVYMACVFILCLQCVMELSGQTMLDVENRKLCFKQLT